VEFSVDGINLAISIQMHGETCLKKKVQTKICLSLKEPC
jgi:hypothetical protein